MFANDPSYHESADQWSEIIHRNCKTIQSATSSLGQSYIQTMAFYHQRQLQKATASFHLISVAIEVSELCAYLWPGDW